MSNASGLDAVAYELADRYRDGRWPELKGGNGKRYGPSCLGI